MYSKDLQTVGGGNADLKKYMQPVERIPLSSLMVKAKEKAYNPEALAMCQRMEMALAKKDLVPKELQEGMYLFGLRQGGTRIGVNYGLVDMETLAKKCAELIPAMCMFLGVPFDSAYFAMCMGIAHHLRNHKSLRNITMEELDEFAMAVFLIPIDSVPEAYQVFDMQAMAQVMEAYNKEVYGKRVGLAGQWLRENMKTAYDQTFEAKRLEREKIDPRYTYQNTPMAQYPDNVQGILAGAYTKYLACRPNHQSHYLAAVAACGIHITVLANFVHQFALTISEPKQGEAAKWAWQRALVESARNDKAREKRLLENGEKIALAPNDTLFLERLVKAHMMAWQFQQWSESRFVSPPQITIEKNG